MVNNQQNAMTHEMNEELEQALSRPADYSDHFAKQVDELCLGLSQSLGINFFHDDHMDYRSAQRIILWLDASHKPTNEVSEAFFEATIFISSRGKFCAVICRHRNVGLDGFWTSVPINSASPSLRLYIQKAKEFLEARSYVFTCPSTLSKYAEGHKTEMDNLPATVFEVLFSEID